MAVPIVHKFDKELYDNYNDNAFKVLQNYFKLLYIDLHKENYDIDVDVYLNQKGYNIKKGLIAKLELEVKLVWDVKDFPFEDVNFLAKKQKYAKQQVVTYWILFNKNFTNCGIIPFTKIFHNELCKIKCENSYDDWVFKIPKKDFVWGLENVESYLIYKAFEIQNNLIKLN